jgi:CelD/BcsL family acetyltransferase involved in cellulose biosynthesis
VIVKRISTEAEFAALRDPWRSLTRGQTQISVFLSWEWQYYWWKNYAAARELYLLAVSGEDQLIGFLPMYRQFESVGCGIQARVLRPIGTGGDTSPDYLGCVATEAEIVDACLGYLEAHRDEWDVAVFSDYLASTTLSERLPNWCRRLKLSTEVGEAERISYFDLPASWDAYLVSLAGERRYKLRSIRRKFLASPQARLFVWESVPEFDIAFDRLVVLHRLRWQSRDKHHAFSSPQYLAFHREVMRAFLINGWLRLYCMALGNEIIAMFYCYLRSGTLYFFQSGFDPTHEQLRPGQCLMAFAIESAIGEKARSFDMLRGQYEYKTMWAKQTQTTLRTMVYQNTAKAKLHRLRHLLAPRFKRRIGKVLAPREAHTR